MLIANDNARTARRPTLPPTAPAKVAMLCAFCWLEDLDDMTEGGREVGRDDGVAVGERESRERARRVQAVEFITKERIKNQWDIRIRQRIGKSDS